MADNSREGWVDWTGGPTPQGRGQRRTKNYEGPVKSFDDGDWGSDIISYRIVTAADDRGYGNGAEGAVTSSGQATIELSKNLGELKPDELAIAADGGDLIERLRRRFDGDHERGCEGRYYICSCGYDDGLAALMNEAAARLASQEETIRADEEALRECLSVFADPRFTDRGGYADMIRARLSARQ
jgi:hypothetical protein